MYLIVGLGNPGREYENTRHNLGFVVLEEIAKKLEVDELKFKQKCNALIGEAKFFERKLILAQPQTFMNLSGDAVLSLSQWYKIPPEKIIVIHDDVDLEPGEIRVKKGGGSGGHHGIESISSRLGSPEYVRVRVGVGRDGFSGDVSKWVLENIPSDDRTKINEGVVNSCDAALSVISEGLAAAMNRFNGQRSA